MSLCAALGRLSTSRARLTIERPAAHRGLDASDSLACDAASACGTRAAFPAARAAMRALQRPLGIAIALALVVAPSIARAEDAPPKTPSPYSLPWSLRPAIAGTVVRADAAFALQDHATTVVPTVLAGYKLLPDTSFFLKVAYAYNAPDATGQSGALVNPLLGALFTPEIAPHLRLAAFAGLTAPVGMGGGASDKSDGGFVAASSGIYARSAMDNALFAVDYFTAIGGLGVAYIDRGLTVQIEGTIFQLSRTRGEAVDTDTSRTNLTSGLHVGYAIAGPLTVSAEIRHQRWLSTPAAVQKDPSKRDQTTAGAGARVTLPLSPGVTARPGIAYFHPLDDPMSAQGYRIVIADVPVSF